MYYHIRISQKSSKSHGEVKLDLSEEQLCQRYIQPYETGLPIIINGKTIPIEDIDRISVSGSDEPSSTLIENIKWEDRNSPVVIIGGSSYAWQAAERATDVTDDFITGAPGSKRLSKSEERKKHSDRSNRKVFIVHGHDHALKSDLEVFCRSIGLEPVVLHREADEGLTVIEKFEQHADVQYAFVLLTPDDVGYTVSEAKKKEKDRKIEFRARQNVIFEFGYFAAKLGRSKVCCIYKEGVQLPSDLGGLIYKKVTDSIEEIGYAVIRELKTAGMDIEMA
jgi:predicted nucleotide-binding protein